VIVVLPAVRRDTFNSEGFISPDNLADTHGMLLGAMGCEVGEHRALACLDYEAMAENVGDLACNGDCLMVGHLGFLARTA
jgi:hypothetical protein